MGLIEILCLSLNAVLTRDVFVRETRLSAVDQIRFPGIYCTLTWVLVQGKRESECLDCFCSVFNILRQLTQPPASCAHTKYDHRWV